MRRREFLLGAAGVAAIGVSGCAGGDEPGDAGARSMNVIVIYLDDMRRDGLEFMPRTRERFVHAFTEARANGGACTDTRLGLSSGTWLQNHPWDWRRTATDHDASRTWGPWMQAAGYRTALFGKYIATDAWTEGIQPGWDVWRTYGANAHTEFDYEIDDGQTPPRLIKPEVGNLEYMMDELIDFVVTSPEPWFASWNPQHPHTDTFTGALSPRPEHQDEWLDLPSPVPVDEDVTGKPQWIQDLPPVSPAEEADIRRAQREQAQVLTGVDDEIERLFTALAAAGRLERSLLFFSSDQGVHYGEHRWGAALGVPAAVQKQTLYDPVVLVPLLATGPGFSAGTTDVPVSQADITATVVAIGGATPTHALDGVDLRTIVDEPSRFADRTLLLQARTLFTPSPSHDTIVTGPDHPRWPLRKYARLATGERELYDLEADPGEFVNLVDDPDQAEAVAWLDAALDDLLGGPGVEVVPPTEAPDQSSSLPEDVSG